MLHGSRTVARVLAREWSDFGTLPDGTQTVADVRDLLANWDPRMRQLNADAQGVAGIGQDFETDLAHLNNRYNAAADPARKAIADRPSWMPGADYSPMQGAYDSILGALKQVPGTVTKGDYDDLVQRLSAARASNGMTTDVPTVQPTTQDVGSGLYGALAKWDLLSQATGGEAPKWGPNAGPPDPLAKLEWLIIYASLGVGAFFGLGLIFAPTLKGAAGLAITVAGGYLGYKGTKAVGQGLGKLQTSPAGQALGV